MSRGSDSDQICILEHEFETLNEVDKQKSATMNI